MPSWQNRAIEIGLRLVGVARSRTSSEAARRRVAAARLRPAPFGPPRSLDREVSLRLARVGGWPVYTASPRDVPSRRVVLFLHGGGYSTEISRFHWRLVADLTKKVPAEVVVPIYPLAPAATAAETVPGVAALVHRLVKEHGAEQMVLMGDSAGGGMALAAAELLRDEGACLPGRIVLLSPWLDATMSDSTQDLIAPTDPFVTARGAGESGPGYAGELDLRDFRVSPLFGDLAGLPPLVVYAGTRDILYTDALALASKARAAGVEVELREGLGMFHDWLFLPIPEARAGRAELIASLAT